MSVTTQLAGTALIETYAQKVGTQFLVEEVTKKLHELADKLAEKILKENEVEKILIQDSKRITGQGLLVTMLIKTKPKKKKLRSNP